MEKTKELLKALVMVITDKENKIYVIFSNIFPAILLVICTIYIVKGSFNPFIYFNF